jgi:peroxiredoxin
MRTFFECGLLKIGRYDIITRLLNLESKGLLLMRYGTYCRFPLLAASILFIILATFVGCKEAPAPKSGEVAPAISCNDVAGEFVSLSQLKNRVVVLYFWSSKCCGDKLKQLEPFYLQNKYSGLSVVAVEVGGAKETVAAFVKKNGFTFTNLSDDYDMISRSYRVIGFPTIFVIDKNGVIRKKISGDIPVEQLNRVVGQFL